MADRARVSQPGESQDLAGPALLPVTPAEQLWFTTLRIEAITGRQILTGTGFVYDAVTGKGRIPLLVTNRHVLEPAKDLRINFLAADSNGNNWERGQQAHWTIKGLENTYWTGHPDVTVDVAVLPLADVLYSMKSDGHRPFYKALRHSSCATDQDFQAWDAIQDVTFVGYPAGIFDAYHGTPIVRRGTTATPMALDYSGMPAFMIDGKVFLGSSGSPVFVGGGGISRLRQGLELGGAPYKLVGILASVATYLEHLKLTPVSVPSMGVETIQYLDLGIVFRVDAISQTIDAFLETHGFSELKKA